MFFNSGLSFEKASKSFVTINNARYKFPPYELSFGEIQLISVNPISDKRLDNFQLNSSFKSF